VVNPRVWGTRRGLWQRRRRRRVGRRGRRRWRRIGDVGRRRFFGAVFFKTASVFDEEVD